MKVNNPKSFLPSINMHMQSFKKIHTKTTQVRDWKDGNDGWMDGCMDGWMHGHLHDIT